MSLSTVLAIPSPRECQGIVGVVVSILGAGGSIATLVAYEGAIWAFVLLALFALLGWTSLLWCVAWAETTPDLREGVGLIGVVAGSVGIGVGLIAGVLYGSPVWSYLLVLASALVVAVSIVRFE